MTTDIVIRVLGKIGDLYKKVVGKEYVEIDQRPHPVFGGWYIDPLVVTKDPFQALRESIKFGLSGKYELKEGEIPPIVIEGPEYDPKAVRFITRLDSETAQQIVERLNKVFLPEAYVEKVEREMRPGTNEKLLDASRATT